jgi:polar amino acid transport system substrate-binding protein
VRRTDADMVQVGFAARQTLGRVGRIWSKGRLAEEKKVTQTQRRVLPLIAVVAMFAAACSSPGASGSTAPSTAASASAAASVAATATPIPAPTSLITAGELSNCVDIEYSPMEYYAESDPNTPIGFDVESYQAVAKKLGLTAKIVPTGFDGLVPAMTAGHCDIVWSALYINATRLQVADAAPYYATSQEVMVLAGNPKNIKSATDLCGLNVSYQSGGLVQERITAASKACTDAGKAAIAAAGYKTVAEEYNQIVIGRVEAVWEIDTSVADFMGKNPDKYAIAYVLDKDNTFGVYYGKGKADLGTALKAALKALKDDGTLAKIAAKYHLDATNLSVIQ